MNSNPSEDDFSLKLEANYLIEKFNQCVKDLNKLSSDQHDDLFKLIDKDHSTSTYTLREISNRVKNLLKVGYVDGKERSAEYSSQTNKFYNSIQLRKQTERYRTDLEKTLLLDQIQWYRMKVEEYLDELKLRKELGKTSMPKKSVQEHSKKSSRFQNVIKKLNKIQEKINYAFEYGDLSKNNEVIDISEELYSIVEKTFPDGKSRTFKLKRKCDKIDAESTDYYGEHYYATDSNPNGIYVYTHNKLLEFFVEQVQKTINELVEMENKNVKEITTIENPILEYLNSDAHSDPFFKNIISEINKSYSMEMYGLAVERIRKLFENLIIDILKKKYQNDTSAYKGSNGNHYQFHIILTNLKKKLKQGDFAHVESELDEVLSWISQMRTEGSKSTHSITFDIDENYLDEIKPKVVRNAELLIRVLNLIK